MEVITLNKNSLTIKCSELKSKIESDPQLIVGILNGGRYVVDELRSHFKESEINLVKLRRETGPLDYFAHSFILKFLPISVLNRLRIYQGSQAKKKIVHLNRDRLSEEYLNFKFDDAFDKKAIKRILIVDDAIDSGRTMFIVKNNLSRLFPNTEIKTAVISWTIETSIIKPDYYIFKEVLVRYPWSKDYKEKDFE